MKAEYIKEKYNLEYLNEEQLKYIEKFNKRNGNYVKGIILIAALSIILSGNTLIYSVYVGAGILAILSIRDRLSFKSKLLMLEDEV